MERWLSKSSSSRSAWQLLDRSSKQSRSEQKEEASVSCEANGAPMRPRRKRAGGRLRRLLGTGGAGLRFHSTTTQTFIKHRTRPLWNVSPLHETQIQTLRQYATRASRAPRVLIGYRQRLGRSQPMSVVSELEVVVFHTKIPSDRL